MYLFIYLLSYTFPLQHSFAIDYLPLTAFQLHWFEVYCTVEFCLLGKHESYLQVNENAVSVSKFTDRENLSLIGRIDLMTLVFFLLLSVAFKLYSPFHATSVIKVNFTTLFQWAAQ